MSKCRRNIFLRSITRNGWEMGSKTFHGEGRALENLRGAARLTARSLTSYPLRMLTCRKQKISADLIVMCVACTTQTFTYMTHVPSVSQCRCRALKPTLDILRTNYKPGSCIYVTWRRILCRAAGKSTAHAAKQYVCRCFPGERLSSIPRAERLQGSYRVSQPRVSPATCDNQPCSSVRRYAIIIALRVRTPVPTKGLTLYKNNLWRYQ